MKVFAFRQPAIAVAALAFVVLNIGLASTLVIAAYGFDLVALADRGALAGRGSAAAELLRWGGLIDMLGYLALAPVVLHVHRRLDRPLLTAAGLGFVLGGALGAALVASVAPPLVAANASDAQELAAARSNLATLEQAVYVGLWAALGQLLLAVWVLGTSWHLRAEGRAFGYLGIGAGLGALGYAIRTGIAGQPPLPIAGPLDILIIAGLGLLPLWVIWLAARLARGAADQ
jgi:hypothetical protein